MNLKEKKQQQQQQRQQLKNQKPETNGIAGCGIPLRPETPGECGGSLARQEIPDRAPDREEDLT